MSSESKSTGIYWIMFLISMAVFVASLFIIPEWCWVTFPFIGTSLVYAFDWV